MSDIDATRRRHYVTDALRGYVDGMHLMGIMSDRDHIYLTSIADDIDLEHERRMEDCRRETRRSTCSYLSRVVADYKRGKKWKRKEYEGGE